MWFMTEYQYPGIHPIPSFPFHIFFSFFFLDISSLFLLCFLTSNPDTIFDGTGRISNIDYIFKTENLTTHWREMIRQLDVQRGTQLSDKKCWIVNWNQHNDIHHIGIPKSQVMDVVRSSPSLMRRMCAIYISDYICFDYPLPPECQHMLHPKLGVCPLYDPYYASQA